MSGVAETSPRLFFFFHKCKPLLCLNDRGRRRRGEGQTEAGKQAIGLPHTNSLHAVKSEVMYILIYILKCTYIKCTYILSQLIYAIWTTSHIPIYLGRISIYNTYLDIFMQSESKSSVKVQAKYNMSKENQLFSLTSCNIKRKIKQFVFFHLLFH